MTGVNGNESVRINVLIGKKMYLDLKEVSDRYRMTISEVVRQRLVEWLMEMKKFEERPKGGGNGER